MKKIAVVLSGCGVFDGAEIYESTLTLLNLDRLDLPYQCLAPNIPQLHVINHLTGEVMEGENRNVLIEAARIARGEIRDLAEAKAEEFSAVIFPGGFGVAKNLCDFAIKGPDCTVHPEVERLIMEAIQLKIPLAFICIAPALMGKVAQKAGLKMNLTLGNAQEWAEKIEAMGQYHQSCPVREVIVDETHRIISTPAYMEAGRISEAADGIERLVKTLANWLR